MKCQRVGCDQGANYAPRIRVPMLGTRIEVVEPLKVVIGLELCRQHAVDCDLAKFLSDDMKRLFQMAATDKGLPDFKRAYMDAVKLDTDEYRELKKAVKKR